MSEPTPRRFGIMWKNGAYYVNIPNYKGGTVVPAEIADTLVGALQSALEFYDSLSQEHRPGEAALLDKMASALALAAPPVEQAKTEVEG